MTTDIKDPVSATIVSEKAVYSGYVSVIRRQVRFTSSALASNTDTSDKDTSRDQPTVIDFDVAGHPAAQFRCAVVFPFHSQTRQVSLVLEYVQGANRYKYALPSGNFDPTHHQDIKQTAVFELEEEANLAGGQWHALLPPNHPGIPEVKWCANAFTPFLCIDPVPHANARPRDWVEVVSGQSVKCVSVERFCELIVQGDVLLPSIATGYMAMDQLKRLGML